SSAERGLGSHRAELVATIASSAQAGARHQARVAQPDIECAIRFHASLASPLHRVVPLRLDKILLGTPRVSCHGGPSPYRSDILLICRFIAQKIQQAMAKGTMSYPQIFPPEKRLRMQSQIAIAKIPATKSTR